MSVATIRPYCFVDPRDEWKPRSGAWPVFLGSFSSYVPLAICVFFMKAQL